jgi:DNA-binding NarL/FixJ family response regulator
MNIIGVQIVDDHPVIREMMEHILVSRDFEIRSKAGSIDEAIADSKKHEIHFVMLDLIFPNSTGEKLVHHYMKQPTPPRMLVYSSTRDLYLPAQCIKAGAMGFVDKGAPMSELITAIETIAIQQQPYISQELQEYLDRDSDQKNQLTPRENEVVRLITLGHSSKMIASELDISERTVNIHRTNLMRKLKAHSMTDVIRHAMNTGLVAPEEMHVKE